MKRYSCFINIFREKVNLSTSNIRVFPGVFLPENTLKRKYLVTFELLLFILRKGIDKMHVTVL